MLKNCVYRHNFADTDQQGECAACLNKKNINLITYHPQSNMSYLKFDKNLMINLEQSLPKEMLRTNQAGAYHCT